MNVIDAGGKGKMGKGLDLIDALRIDGMTMASNVLEVKVNFGLDFGLELYKDTSRVRAIPGLSQLLKPNRLSIFN